MELKMSKKASANMWWIIIGAVIALVVMIILMVMFTGKTQPLEAGLSSCESKGGVCATPPGLPCPSNTFTASAFDCDGAAVCCIGSPKTCKDPSDTSCGDTESKRKCGTYPSGKSYCYTSK